VSAHLAGEAVASRQEYAGNGAGDRKPVAGARQEPERFRRELRRAPSGTGQRPHLAHSLADARRRGDGACERPSVDRRRGRRQDLVLRTAARAGAAGGAAFGARAARACDQRAQVWRPLDTRRAAIRYLGDADQRRVQLAFELEGERRSKSERAAQQWFRPRADRTNGAIARGTRVGPLPSRRSHLRDRFTPAGTAARADRPTHRAVEKRGQILFARRRRPASHARRKAYPGYRGRAAGVDGDRIEFGERRLG